MITIMVIFVKKKYYALRAVLWWFSEYFWRYWPYWQVRQDCQMELHLNWFTGGARPPGSVRSTIAWERFQFETSCGFWIAGQFSIMRSTRLSPRYKPATGQPTRRPMRMRWRHLNWPWHATGRSRMDRRHWHKANVATTNSTENAENAEKFIGSMSHIGLIWLIQSKYPGYIEIYRWRQDAAFPFYNLSHFSKNSSSLFLSQ